MSKLREAFEALLGCTPYSPLRFGKTTTARAIDTLRTAIEEAEREIEKLRISRDVLRLRETKRVLALRASEASGKEPGGE